MVARATQYRTCQTTQAQRDPVTQADPLIRACHDLEAPHNQDAD